MTGEFRGKLWAHRARDWAINSPECGALIMVSVIVLKIFLFKFVFNFYSICFNFSQYFLTALCAALIMMSVIVLKIGKLKS